MTDQAVEQSGSAEQAQPEHSENDLAGAFAAAYGEPQPKGQADNQTEQPAGDTEQVDEQASGEPVPEKFKVPALEGDGFDELTAEELKAQRLMQADYTRKTQALADERKAINAERQKVEQVIAEKAGALEQQLAMLGRAIQSFDQQVDWDALRQVDPGAYLEAREQQAHRLQAFEHSRQQMEAVRQAQRSERVAQSTQRLVEAMPELLDPQAAKKFASRIVEGTAHYGFSPEEVQGLEDHRLVLMARDAIAYRELKAKAAEVKPKVAAAPQLAKPGAPKPGNAEALNAYRTIQKASQTGEVKDLAAAFGTVFK